jgi:hypothetical protein
VDLCGSLWIFVDLCGSLWIFVDICGYSIQSYLPAGRPVYHGIHSLKSFREHTWDTLKKRRDTLARLLARALGLRAATDQASADGG